MEGSASTIGRISGFEQIESRIQRLQRFYDYLGYPEVKVPNPTNANGFIITDAEYHVMKGQGFELFFRAATFLCSYAEMMRQLGQKFHWTVNAKCRDNISWEKDEFGYWFWAYVGQDLHFNEAGYDELKGLYVNQKIRFALLEEYAITSCIWRTDTGQILDQKNAIWLATRFRGFPLSAKGESHGINIGVMDGMNRANDPQPDIGIRLNKKIG